MLVTETAAAGLKREYRVVVPATDLEARVNERLDDLKGRVQLRGFRPGKVPVAHLKRLYGKSAMAEVIEATVRETNNKIITEHGFKLATEPKVVLPSGEGDVEGVIDGKSDLAYTVELEIVPPITLGDFKTIKLERLSAAVSDAEIDQVAQSIAEQNRPFTAKAEGAEKGDRVTISCRGSIERAEQGDRLTISFRGTTGAQPSDDGTEENLPIVLGSGRFLPGFDDNLIGLKSGESRTFNLKLPDDYASPALAGKEATFAVGVTSVEAPGTVMVDDEFAKSLGFDSLAKLREALRERLQRDHAGVSRQKLKRALLDQLDERHKFEPPPTLVEEEFNHVWTALENDLKQQGRTFADEGTTEEQARAEYRAIAERRVRLGLVIAEIGERNNISVSEEQLQAAVMEQVRQMPGRERQVWDYYRNNPGALAALRAPLFEDKVVDFLLELAEVTDKQVSREELLNDDVE